MALLETASSALTYGRTAPTPETLVKSHLPLVRKIAWHVHGRVSSAIEIEDLIQIGLIALIEAANAYEDRGHAFATYATLRVRGAMIDHLRRSAAQCRSAMIKRRDLTRAIEVQRRLHGREPNDAELAASMGIDADMLFALKTEARSVQHDSIDAVYSDHSLWFADQNMPADEEIDQNRLQSAIARAIRTLPEREAVVLQLYFVEEMNLQEIGATLDIGAARVCQIKKVALDKVRGLLGDW